MWPLPLSLRLHLRACHLYSCLSVLILEIPLPPQPPDLSDCSLSLPGSGPTAGWLWSSLWVGEPQIAATWNKHFNTCSCWQPATTAHCLPTSHFNLKTENCQTNVLATALCHGCMGNLAAAPARSWSCEEDWRRGLGCWMVLGMEPPPSWPLSLGTRVSTGKLPGLLVQSESLRASLR